MGRKIGKRRREALRDVERGGRGRWQRWLDNKRKDRRQSNR